MPVTSKKESSVIDAVASTMMAPTTGAYGMSCAVNEKSRARAFGSRLGTSVARAVRTGAAIQPATSGVAVKLSWPSASKRT